MAAIEEEEELVDGETVQASDKHSKIFQLKAAVKDAGNRAKIIKETKYGPADKEEAPEGLPALIQKNLLSAAKDRERV